MSLPAIPNSFRLVPVAYLQDAVDLLEEHSKYAGSDCYWAADALEQIIKQEGNDDELNAFINRQACISADSRCTPDGQFFNREVQMVWLGWQARATVFNGLSAQLPEEKHDSGFQPQAWDNYDKGWNECLAEVKKILGAGEIE